MNESAVANSAQKLVAVATSLERFQRSSDEGEMSDLRSNVHTIS